MSIEIWTISQDYGNGANFNFGYSGTKKAYLSLGRAMRALKGYRREGNSYAKYQLWHGTISPVEDEGTVAK